MSGETLSQLRDYADSNGFLRVIGPNDEIHHFQLWEISQGARCILAESGPLKFVLVQSSLLLRKAEDLIG